MIDIIKNTLPEAIGDALTFHAAGTASYIAAGSASYILETLLQNRMRSASKIWHEIANDHWDYPLTDDQKEELVSIIDTFLRYAREEAAQENLKLLAQIVAGQKASKAVRANEFIHYANLLVPLSHEEVCLLATLTKHKAFKKR